MLKSASTPTPTEGSKTVGRWYHDVRRWGQTNLTEIDPERYESQFWIRQWKRTKIDAVIVNAGGIVAYYPTSIDGHTTASHLHGRDLFGTICADARDRGLAVVARIDSSRVSASAAADNSEWLARRANGSPYRIGEHYAVCVNSSYYLHHLPTILQEILERYEPDGVADNSWSGLDRRNICYCAVCQQAFGEYSGAALPRVVTLSDSHYVCWYRWNVARRSEIWATQRDQLRRLGGPDCLWLGMLPASVTAQVDRFMDARHLVRDSPLVLIDHQFRGAGRFEDNSEIGSRFHEMLPAGARVAESMAMYKAGTPTFRLSAMPSKEVEMWAGAAFAGGIDPWWHHIGAANRDRRQLDSAARVFHWHVRHQEALKDRTSAAQVAVLWSEQNTLLHGGTDAPERTEAPRQGLLLGLLNARVPAVSLHVDDLPTQGWRFRTIVLPEMVVLSTAQLTAIRGFIAAGGSAIASGAVGTQDEDGRPHARPGIASEFGVTLTGAVNGATGPHPSNFERAERHTYLRARLHDFLPDEEILWSGLERTDITGFGGQLQRVRPLPGAKVPITALPAVSVYPPETSWLPADVEGNPAVVLTMSPETGSRTVYLAADIDRCAGRDALVDHRQILGNLVRWTLRGETNVVLEGPGEIDLRPYRQGDRWVIHLLDASASNFPGGTVSRLAAQGPFRIGIEDPQGQLTVGHSTVAAQRLEITRTESRTWVDLPSLDGYETVIVE